MHQTIKRLAIIVFCAATTTTNPYFGALASANGELENTQTDIQFVSNTSPIGNLFYQIECLGNRIRCSQSAYQDHWSKIGPLDSDDHAAITRFANILDVYDFRAQLGRRSADRGVTDNRFGTEVVDIGPSPSESFSLLSRIRLAAYGAATPDDLFNRLALIMQPNDVAVLRATVGRLWPRFSVWWDADAASQLGAFDSVLAETLAELNGETLPAIASFFRLQTPDNGLTLTVHLVAHPLEQSSTNAEVIENQAVVEVLAGESPSARVGVIVHELVHYLFATAPRDVHDIRLEGALRADNPRAAAALGLMNEALAAAIGNGFVEEKIRGKQFDEYFRQDRSFYARAEIDTAAKAIYPLVNEYLTDHKTIDENFVDQYFVRVSDAVGADLDSLSSRLRVSAYIAADEPLAQAMRRTPRLLGLNSLYGSTLNRGETVADSVLYRHTYLNGVILLREEDRSTVGALLPEASTEKLVSIRTGASDSCVFTRPSRSSIYFLVVDASGPTEEQLVALLQSAEPCRLD